MRVGVLLPQPASLASGGVEVGGVAEESLEAGDLAAQGGVGVLVLVLEVNQVGGEVGDRYVRDSQPSRARPAGRRGGGRRLTDRGGTRRWWTERGRAGSPGSLVSW